VSTSWRLYCELGRVRRGCIGKIAYRWILPNHRVLELATVRNSNDGWLCASCSLVSYRFVISGHELRRRVQMCSSVPRDNGYETSLRGEGASPTACLDLQLRFTPLPCKCVLELRCWCPTSPFSRAQTVKQIRSGAALTPRYG